MRPYVVPLTPPRRNAVLISLKAVLVVSKKEEEPAIAHRYSLIQRHNGSLIYTGQIVPRDQIRPLGSNRSANSLYSRMGNHGAKRNGKCQQE